MLCCHVFACCVWCCFIGSSLVMYLLQYVYGIERNMSCTKCKFLYSARSFKFRCGLLNDLAALLPTWCQFSTAIKVADHSTNLVIIVVNLGVCIWSLYPSLDIICDQNFDQLTWERTIWSFMQPHSDHQLFSYILLL